MIDVVMITNGKRLELFMQSIHSLFDNASEKSFKLTVVYDGIMPGWMDNAITISTPHPVGASAARNIGASSIPKYRSGEYVMFLDDDVYMCPGWDEKLLKLAGPYILSGYAHPFNHTVLDWGDDWYETTVLSTVHMFMPWWVWDHVGFFVEPGGPGGSEDVDYCKRATELKYRLVVTKPHCVIHTGLTGSGGKRIVGYPEMFRQNAWLLKYWGLEGKVVFS